MREAEGRVIPHLWEIGVSAWGQAGVDEAYATFFAHTPIPDDLLSHPEHESLFLTWLALRFAPAPTRKRPSRSAPRMLLDEAHDLSEFERRFVEEAAHRPVTFHGVTAVAPGLSIDLEDILTGETRRVIERTASKTVRPGGIIYARVVTLDNVSIMVGSGATMLPPMRRADLADLRASIAGRRGRLTESDVFAFDDLLRRWYLLAADQERNPPPPKLTNTDGDPLAPTTLHFALRCTADEAFAALRSLNVSDEEDDELLQEAERDAKGQLHAFSLDWSKAGNRVHQSWDNTILGHLEVRGDALTASVNSNRRAARLRRQIEKRFGRRVMFLRAVIESMDAMLEEARSRPSEAPADPMPELTAEFERQHWDEWLDMRIPALKNATPRQAARTPEGRERLEALLAELEWRGGAPVQRLRDALKV